MIFIKVRTIYNQVAIINCQTINSICEDPQDNNIVDIWLDDGGSIKTKLPISKFLKLLIKDGQYDLTIRDD